MRKFLKWIGLGVLGLLAATLLLVLAWVASNWHDAEPQPIPAALAAPPAQSGEGGLLAALDAAPGPKETVPWPNCSGSDCQAAFEAQSDALLRWRERHVGVGKACDGALERTDWSLGEAIPVALSVDAVVPSYHPLSACHGWVLLEAWQASQTQDDPRMLKALDKANRIEGLVRRESRLLIGQMVGASQTARKLSVVVVLATQHPEQRAALAERIDLPSADLMLAMRQWVPTEAAFGRAAAVSMSDTTKADEGNGPAWFGRWVTKFLHPEKTQQLFSAHWMRVLACLDGQDLTASADCWRSASEPEPGLFGSGIHWRHTTAHLLADVARPAWPSYMDRIVDLHHASQATQAWLRGQAPTTAIDTAPDGSWTLRLRDPGQTHRLPTQWAPLPKDR